MVKRICLALLALLFVAIGVLSTFLPEGSPGAKAERIVTGLSFGILTCTWCISDARQKGYSLGYFVRGIIVLCAPIGVPAYFFRSRGFLKGLIATSLALLLFAFLIAISMGAEFITYRLRSAAG